MINCKYKKYMTNMASVKNNNAIKMEASIREIKKDLVKQRLKYVYRDIRDLKWKLEGKESFNEKEWNEMIMKLNELMQGILKIRDSVENI